MADPPSARHAGTPPSQDKRVLDDPQFKKLKRYVKFLPYEIEPMDETYRMMDMYMLRMAQVDRRDFLIRYCDDAGLIRSPLLIPNRA